MTCARGRDVIAWEREGSGAPLPEALRAHASACDECAARIEEVRGPREWLAGAPAHPIDRGRREEMRFALMSAARTSAKAAGSGTVPRRRPWRGAAFGVAALSIAAVAATLALALAGRDGAPPVAPDRADRPAAPEAEAPHGRERASAADRPPPGPMVDRGERASAADRPLIDRGARVLPGRGARVVAVRPAPDAVHRVVAGSVRFEVDALPEGERFRVIAGDATVEVRGTAFRVDVRDGLLREVEVDEGHVVLRIGDRTVAHLRAGARWTRRELPAATAPAREALSPPAVTEPPPSHEAGASAPAAETRGAARPDTAAAHRADREFALAFRLHREGDHARAAALLDALASDPALDAGRRADVLYWSARAHEALGDAAAARDRAARSLEAAPESWHAARARALLDAR